MKWDFLSYFDALCSALSFSSCQAMTWSLVFLVPLVVNVMLYKMGFCMTVLSAYCCLGDFRPYLGTTLLSIDVEGEACDKTWDLLFTWRGERSFSSTNNEEGLPSPCLTFRSQMKETTATPGIECRRERKKLFLLQCWCWCSSRTKRQRREQ